MATFTEDNDDVLVELIAKNPPLYDSRLKTYKDNVVRDNIWEHIASKLKKTSDDCRKRWKCIRDSYQRIKRKHKLPTGSAAGSKSKKWSLLERLSFLENVPTERRTICNIERTNDTNDSENEVSNYDKTCSNNEKDINAEPNEIEMNSEGTSGTAVSAPTSATEVNVEETADDEEQNKKARRCGGVLKKKKLSQSTTMQAAILQYWKERDTERRTQIQDLTHQSTSNQEQEPDVDGIKSFCSHIGTMLSKLTPALKIQAKTKVFNILADFELQSLNQSSITCSSSSPFDQSSQFSSTNPYSPISSVASPSSLGHAADLTTSNTFNLPTENMSNTLHQLENRSYSPISSVASPSAFGQAADLSTSKTFNLPTNTSENINLSNTLYQLENRYFQYLP